MSVLTQSQVEKQAEVKADPDLANKICFVTEKQKEEAKESVRSHVSKPSNKSRLKQRHVSFSSDEDDAANVRIEEDDSDSMDSFINDEEEEDEEEGEEEEDEDEDDVEGEEGEDERKSDSENEWYNEEGTTLKVDSGEEKSDKPLSSMKSGMLSIVNS